MQEKEKELQAIAPNQGSAPIKKERRTFLQWLDDASNGLQVVIAIFARTLLLLGTILASANFLGDDFLFGPLPWLRNFWAFDQAVAVDANLAILGSMWFAAIASRSKAKIILFSIIGGMLLFVAAVIMDIESVRQALNISLSQASDMVRIPMNVITQMRAVVVVGLVAIAGEVIHGEHQVKSKDTPSPVKAKKAIKPTAKPNPTVSLDPYTEFVKHMERGDKLSGAKMAVALGVSQSTVTNFRKRYANGILSARSRVTDVQESKGITVLHATPSVE